MRRPDYFLIPPADDDFNWCFLGSWCPSTQLYTCPVRPPQRLFFVCIHETSSRWRISQTGSAIFIKLTSDSKISRFFFCLQEIKNVTLVCFQLKFGCWAGKGKHSFPEINDSFKRTLTCPTCGLIIAVICSRSLQEEAHRFKYLLHNHFKKPVWSLMCALGGLAPREP